MQAHSLKQRACLLIAESAEWQGVNETLALAASLSFNPYVDCAQTIASSPPNTAFIGPLQLLRTGPVLQAFYHIPRRQGCPPSQSSSRAEEAPRPPLLLLAGMGSTTADWRPTLLGELACSRELIVLEERGAGKSVDYSGERLTYDSMADSVRERRRGRVGGLGG